MNQSYNSIIITGTTASGKTALAVRLAAALNGAIISADSRQVYKNLNIGTGKDLFEYEVNDVKIPYYLIDVTEVDTHFHLYNYITYFFDAFNEIESRQKLPIICGGTGLYLDAVLKKLELAAIPNNLELRAKIENWSKEKLIEKLSSYVTKPEKADLSSHKRLVRAVEIAEYLNNTTIPKVPFVDLNPIIFALDLPTELRRNKISARLNYRLENGMVEEVQQLLLNGISHERLQFLGLEYQYISKYLLAEISFDEMFLKLETAIHKYAKRQMTWFRKMEREQKKIHWLDATKPMEDILNEVLSIIAR